MESIISSQSFAKSRQPLKPTRRDFLGAGAPALLCLSASGSSGDGRARGCRQPKPTAAELEVLEAIDACNAALDAYDATIQAKDDGIDELIKRKADPSLLADEVTAIHDRVADARSRFQAARDRLFNLILDELGFGFDTETVPAALRCFAVTVGSYLVVIKLDSRRRHGLEPQLYVAPIAGRLERIGR